MPTSRSLWPLFIIGMLTLVGIANGITYYLATTTELGLVEDSPYERGLGFEETVEARRNASKLDGRVTFQATHTGVDLLFSGDTAPLAEAPISLKGFFGADSDADFSCTPRPNGPLQSGCSLALRPGTWIFVASMEQNDKRYQFEGRSIVGRP